MYLLCSLLQFFWYIDAERTMAEIPLTKGQGKFALWWTFFQTVQVLFQTKVFRFAQVFKTVLGANEIFRTLHLADDLFDLLLDVVIHGLCPQMLNCRAERNHGDGKSLIFWQAEHYCTSYYTGIILLRKRVLVKFLKLDEINLKFRYWPKHIMLCGIQVLLMQKMQPSFFPCLDFTYLNAWQSRLTGYNSCGLFY